MPATSASRTSRRPRMRTRPPSSRRSCSAATRRSCGTSPTSGAHSRGAILSRRYEAKLRYELDFGGRFHDVGGIPDGYEESLTAATGVRYRRSGFLSDMDAGFYSADYLRAWVRKAQLRRYLIENVGADWWRNRATGDFLRELFLEGTRPSSEEIAHRIGYDPLDTAPLLHELGA